MELKEYPGRSAQESAPETIVAVMLIVVVTLDSQRDGRLQRNNKVRRRCQSRMSESNQIAYSLAALRCMNCCPLLYACKRAGHAILVLSCQMECTPLMDTAILRESTPFAIVPGGATVKGISISTFNWKMKFPPKNNSRSPSFAAQRSIAGEHR
jgi:hypothetical protein